MLSVFCKPTASDPKHSTFNMSTLDTQIFSAYKPISLFPHISFASMVM